METKPAYITIVEGPPPEFQVVANEWVYGVAEGPYAWDVAVAEMRTFDGPKLVKRCTDAWDEGRSAKLNFPVEEGDRAELDIIAARWETVEEGHKLYLWVRLDDSIEFEQE